MLKIEEITTTTDFLGLAGCWNSLLAGSAAESIFLTWEWISNWWKVYGKENALRVLVARDGNGEAVAIAPFYTHERIVMSKVPVREIRFLGTGGDVSPDYLDIISLGDREDEAADAFTQYLMNRKDWDVLSLTDLLPTSFAARLLQKSAFNCGLIVKTRDCAICPYIQLPLSWEEYLCGLGPNMRYNVKRRIRNLDKAFKTRYFVWEDRDCLKDAMERLAKLHIRRWLDRSHSHSFSSPEYNAFHQAVASDFAGRGWLSLSCLELDGQIAGMFYDYHYGGKMYYYQGGFDPHFSKYSLGLVLRAHVIRQAIEGGTKEFDLLKGAYEYKYLWTAHDRTTMTLAIGKKSLAAKLFFLETFEKPRLKALIRRNVPEHVLRLVK